MGVSQYPIHELIHCGETYRGIANAWVLNLRALEWRYALLPRKWRELDFARTYYPMVSKLVASGYQALGMSTADVQEMMLITTRTDADRALPLYSLLRALYKMDSLMVFYAIKAMVR